MDERLKFWRRIYDGAPLKFRPVIVALGKLIKLGNTATTKDVSPADFDALCKFADVNVVYPTFNDAKIYSWNLSAEIIDELEYGTYKNYNRRLLEYAADYFKATEPDETVAQMRFDQVLEIFKDEGLIRDDF